MAAEARENKTKVPLGILRFFPLLFITCYSFGQTVKPPLVVKDTLTKPIPAGVSNKKGGADSAMVTKDSTVVVVDTLRLPMSSDSLDAPVKYEAADSGVLDIPNSKFYLYGKAHVVYNTLDLKAATIEIDNEQNVARAYFNRDTTGKVIDRPILVDGDMTSESDSMFYNFKSQRGITKSTYTKQGEMFVFAERIKKVDAQSFFASNGRFTTCNLDTPHFAFRARKMKLVNNKWAYSGLAYPEFESIPMPIGLPFGIYPLSQGRHSGLLAPQFSATENFGLGLEGLGYYKVLNNNVDVTLRTNIYSYGGFAINLNPSYRVRYKYNGGFRLSFQNTRINFKGDPDFQTAKTFNFSWTHSMDGKARPGTVFSSNINFGSIKYNQFVANSPQLNFTNLMQSSVQYSKSWGAGKYNMSVTGNHSQNNNTGQYNVSLPNVNMTVNTFYPFKPREAAGEAKWYEKLGIGYNGQLLNQFSFFQRDSPRLKYNLQQILDTMQWGAQHIIPINLALPAIGPITVSPQVSFSERWYGQQILKQWIPSEKRLDTFKTKGFFAAREVSFGIGLQTAIFGTLNFGKKSNIRAIRHVMRPILSANYRPDLQQRYFYRMQVDSTGRTELLSVFEGSLFNTFSPGRFGGLNFGLQNNMEMKVRDKSDSSNPNATKKIKLIDIFSVTSSFNFLKDTQQLDPFNILISTTILDKINITGSTILNPYILDSTGRNTNLYAWQGKQFSLGTFTNGSLSIGASFQSQKKNQDKNKAELSESNNVMTPDEQMRQQEYIRNNPAEFADFNIPWSLNVAYALSFTKVMKPDFSGFRSQTFSNLTLNGDFSISPKWKMGGAMFYDLKTRKIGTLNMFLSRELHCWQMAINIVPIGLFRSFNISISPRSSILRDLKVNRTRSYYQ